MEKGWKITITITIKIIKIILHPCILKRKFWESEMDG
jgi:hypothetical protein